MKRPQGAGASHWSRYPLGVASVVRAMKPVRRRSLRQEGRDDDEREDDQQAHFECESDVPHDCQVDLLVQLAAASSWIPGLAAGETTELVGFGERDAVPPGQRWIVARTAASVAQYVEYWGSLRPKKVCCLQKQGR
jgi:hypothetical protein